MTDRETAGWRWYLSIAAIRQWMAATGRRGPAEPANADYRAAELELGELSRTAKIARAATTRQVDGGIVYRGHVLVGTKRIRVEAIVMPWPRDEGPLPQLVRVRRK